VSSREFNRDEGVNVAWSAAARLDVSVGCKVAMQGLARHQLDGADTVEQSTLICEGERASHAIAASVARNVG
jgi:hypothetical protein